MLPFVALSLRGVPLKLRLCWCVGPVDFIAPIAFHGWSFCCSDMNLAIGGPRSALLEALALAERSPQVRLTAAQADASELPDIFSAAQALDGEQYEQCRQGHEHIATTTMLDVGFKRLWTGSR